MAASLPRVPALTIPHLHRNRLLAILALAALGVSLGFWYWSSHSKPPELRLSSGVELRYRTGMVSVLCEEAAEKGLRLDIQSNKGRSTRQVIGQVESGELDAAVIPAGLATEGANIRQVAMLECETLHLFLRPELYVQGIAGLRGKRINLGPQDSGVSIIAETVLKFMGMKRGEDYQDDAHAYTDLIKLPPEAMPDAVFGLSPLPSPLGQKLVERYAYQLMELPFGEALALRYPYFEDASVPANTYGVHPAVPPRPLHTVGTRSVLIANANVSKIAIRRLLEVLYESDFARRVGMPPLDAKLLGRSGEYPTHAGTTAYLRRHDPLINTELVERLKNLRGDFFLVPAHERPGSRLT